MELKHNNLNNENVQENKFNTVKIELKRLHNILITNPNIVNHIRRDLRAPKGRFRHVPIVGNYIQQLEFKIKYINYKLIFQN